MVVDGSLTACHRRHASVKGAGRKDLHVLPLLLYTARCRGSPDSHGTFLETRALNGVEATQTRLVEQCHNWTGLLIEKDSARYKELTNHSRRAARKLFSQVGECSSPGRGLPCTKSLFDAWREHGPNARLNYLALHGMEGGEVAVLTEMYRELKSLPIDVLLVEAPRGSRALRTRTQRLEEMLKSAGYEKLTPPQGFGIPTYSEHDVWVTPWLYMNGAQRLLYSTASSTLRPRNPVFEYRRCGHTAPAYLAGRSLCNVSMRDGALTAVGAALSAPPSESSCSSAAKATSEIEWMSINHAERFGPAFQGDALRLEHVLRVPRESPFPGE